MRIDAHHHFWHYNADDYGWIDDSMERIRRDFLPADLEEEAGSAGVDRVVTVQARQSLDETRWLLHLAGQHELIAGVVGWVPLVAPNLREHLDHFGRDPALKAVRHVVQDEPDEDFVLREDFNSGVRLLREFSLAYDVLIHERQLPQAIQFVDRHPEQVFVLDHLAKPRIRDGVLEPWATRLRELAHREHVYCKLSGLVTEADSRRWNAADLRPYWETALDAFGPTRLMFGSDWPVCLVGCEYQKWVDVVHEFVRELSSAEQASLWHETARRAYRLDVSPGRHNSGEER